jgi:hypothetical protein
MLKSSYALYGSQGAITLGQKLLRSRQPGSREIVLQRSISDIHAPLKGVIAATKYLKSV